MKNQPLFAIQKTKFENTYVTTKTETDDSRGIVDAIEPTIREEWSMQ